MNISYGVENGGTPIGNREDLEKLAARVNEQARQEWLAKCRQAKQQQESRENKSAR